MLKKILTVFAASAVALGLSMGVANASTPTRHDNCVGTNILSCTNGGGLPVVGNLLGSNGGPLGGGLLRRRFPGLPGLYGGNLINLNLLGVENGGFADVCNFGGVPAFDTWGLHRFGGRWRASRAARLRAEEFAAYQTEGCGSSVGYGWSPYLNGGYLNMAGWGDPYGQFAVCPYTNWDSFSGFYRGRLGGRFNRFGGLFGHDPYRSFGALRGAACGGGVVTEPIPVPVPVPTGYDPGTACVPCSSPASYEPNNNTVVPQSAPNLGNSGLAPNTVKVG